MCHIALMPEQTPRSIDQRLIRVRKLTDQTIKDVAQYFGVNKNTVCRWESAAYWINLPSSFKKRLLLLQLAEFYWIDYGWLLHGVINKAIQVMIVDDQPGSRAISSLLLQSILGDKLCVFEFENSATALDWSHANYADFVLCDYHRPDENTPAFIRALRNDAGYQTTPIVVLTADKCTMIKNACLAADAQSVIHKPVNQETLQALCQYYLPYIDSSLQ